VIFESLTRQTTLAAKRLRLSQQARCLVDRLESHGYPGKPLKRDRDAFLVTKR